MFSISSGALPPGLTLNNSTGAITGTPNTFGTFTFTITATDVNGCSGSRQYTINVSSGGNCPVITLSPATLPPGAVQVPYSQQVTASGGIAPYTYSISSGALPPGLFLNQNTGLISGVPQLKGIYNFTVQAMDSVGCFGARAYELVITVGPAFGSPTLDYLGLAILVVLLGGAGLFVIKKLSL
jgi:hypothetical protein